MNTKHFLISCLTGLVLFCSLLLSGEVRAQDSGSVNQALQVARQAVSPKVQNQVVSVYGIGTPDMIEKWYVIFYDPTVPSHGRAALVENNHLTRTYPANGGVTYSAKLTFDPSRISSEGPALSAAQGYAAKHHVVYDSVKALLKLTSAGKPLRWRVDLINKDQNRGYVLVNVTDDTVADYVPPASGKGTSSGPSDDGDKGFAHDVEKTFLGIGGDLEEFFTGERTVDK